MPKLKSYYASIFFKDTDYVVCAFPSTHTITVTILDSGIENFFMDWSDDPFYIIQKNCFINFNCEFNMNGALESFMWMEVDEEEGEEIDELVMKSTHLAIQKSLIDECYRLAFNGSRRR